MRIPGWRGMPTDSLSRRIEDVLRVGAARSHARRRATRRRRAESGRVGAHGAARRVANAHDALGGRARHVVDLDVGHRAARSRAAPISPATVRDGVTAARSPVAAVAGRHGGGGRPTRVRRAHPTVPGRSVLLGMVAASRAGVLRSSVRRRAADPNRRFAACANRTVGDAVLGSARAGACRVGRECSDRGDRRACRRRGGGDARCAHHVGDAARRGGTRSRNARRAAPRRDRRRDLLPCSRAREPVGSSGSLRWWIATGVALGVAFSSKYTSILLPVAVVVAVVVRRELRARLREPGPYVACVVAALVFIPVLVWNANHGWISFVFQLRHGLSAPQGSALVGGVEARRRFFRRTGGARVADSLHHDGDRRRRGAPPRRDSGAIRAGDVGARVVCVLHL